MKLHQQLEQLLKIRVNSNADIIPAIKRLSEMGKFDEPKKIAVIAILLDRMGKMEDEQLVEQSLKETTTTIALEDIATPPDSVVTPPTEAIIETPSTETPVEPSNPTVAENQTLPSALDDLVAMNTEEQSASSEELTPSATLPEEQTTATISSFTPENITDPAPQNPVETTT